MSVWNKARVAKSYNFSASHQLSGPAFGDCHPCSRLHGHNYVVEVEVRGDINPEKGIVLDFHYIDGVIKPLIEKLDHQHLNDILDEIPTAENLAKWIMENAPVKIFYSVKVWETPKCWAQVINKDGLYRWEEKSD